MKKTVRRPTGPKAQPSRAAAHLAPPPSSRVGARPPPLPAVSEADTRPEPPTLPPRPSHPLGPLKGGAPPPRPQPTPPHAAAASSPPSRRRRSPAPPPQATGAAPDPPVVAAGVFLRLTGRNRSGFPSVFLSVYFSVRVFSVYSIGSLFSSSQRTDSFV